MASLVTYERLDQNSAQKLYDKLMNEEKLTSEDYALIAEVVKRKFNLGPM